MTGWPSRERYDSMRYRRCGRSGILLPAISLGLWHNFGHDRPVDTQGAILRRAFDLGITHVDLAGGSQEAAIKPDPKVNRGQGSRGQHAAALTGDVRP